VLALAFAVMVVVLAMVVMVAGHLLQLSRRGMEGPERMRAAGEKQGEADEEYGGTKHGETPWGKMGDAVGRILQVLKFSKGVAVYGRT
jgi:hypothetical protein